MGLPGVGEWENLPRQGPPEPPPQGLIGSAEERLPGDQRGGDEGVVVRIRTLGGDGVAQRLGAELERLRPGVGRAESGGEVLGALGRGGQSRLTAAAAARIRIIAPYPR